MNAVTRNTLIIVGVIAMLVFVVWINRPRTPDTSNIARGRVVSASSTYQASAPGNAVDGDPSTGWNAGDGPPAWIEVDLGGPCRVTEIRLLVEQSPPGPTVHRLYLGTETRDVLSTEELSQETTEGQELVLPVNPDGGDVRYVRVETVASPSWVAWKEVEVWGTCP